MNIIAEPPFTTGSKSRTGGRRKRKYENGLSRYWRKKEDEGKRKRRKRKDAEESVDEGERRMRKKKDANEMS